MTFSETPIAGAFLILLNRRSDPRGSFARVWSLQSLQQHGITHSFVECNTSVTRKRGTIRGLHYQRAPHQEAKLVQCTKGAVFDVLVDLRPDSLTRHQWAGFELKAGSDHLIYVPPGCAHGIQALEDDSEITYAVSAAYHPGAEGGLRWNDPFFGIHWPIVENVIVSDKDAAWPLLEPVRDQA